MSDPKNAPIADFYDALAPDYDTMTGFGKRFAAEQPSFATIVERYGVKTAVDAGCGTGFHSLLLARLGVAVTAVDVSPGMLERAIHHARELALEVKTVESDFINIANNIHGRYDAVFCLGNSIAHLINEDDLRSSIRSFASLLLPGGILFIQTLNYDRILSRRERVQNVKEIGTTTFVRFYDFETDALRFNILKLEKKDGAIVHSLHSVPLRPVRRDELETLLPENGLPETSFFGSIALDPFKAESSNDLVTIARATT